MHFSMRISSATIALFNDVKDHSINGGIFHHKHKKALITRMGRYIFHHIVHDLVHCRIFLPTRNIIWIA